MSTTTAGTGSSPDAADHDASDDGPAAGRARPSVPLDALWLTVIAVSLWVWGAARVDVNGMSDAGLISVLGWPVLAAFGVLALATVRSLAEVERSGRLLALQTVALVVMVQGLPAVVEPHPSYFTAYLHVGFVQEIVATGRTVPGLDARFNWPGSFALGALITSVGGTDSALTFLRWSPTFFNLAYLAPLWMIGRSVVADVRVRWIALWLFVAANWVHQDYFAPQAETYFLYLVVVAVVLRWFGNPGAAVAGRWSARAPRVLARLRGERDRLTRLDAGSGEAVRTDDATDRMLVRALVVILAAVVVSHQITPFAALLVLGALVAIDRCWLRTLPMIVLVLFAGWFAVGATTWWSDHLGELIGDFGKFGSNVSSGVLGRLGGTDPMRSFVLALRVLFSGAMLGGGALVALRRWRRGAPPLVLLAILLPPFALAGGQSYGGEVLLRSYLFALPASTLLVAEAIRGGPRARFGRRRVAVTAVVLGLIALGGVAVRFGNERFEQVTSSDLAASEWVYANAPRGSVLISPTRNVPWRYRDLTAYDYEPTDEEPIDKASEVLAYVPDDAPAYFLASDAQERFGAQLGFLDDGWLPRLERALLATGRATEVFRSGDAVVYRLDPEPAP